MVAASVVRDRSPDETRDPVATVLQAHAGAAKAGVDALIRIAAVEYGPFGVRVNTIAREFIIPKEWLAC